VNPNNLTQPTFGLSDQEENMKYLVIILLAALISAPVLPMQQGHTSAIRNETEKSSAGMDYSIVPFISAVEPILESGTSLDSSAAAQLIPANDKKFEYCTSVKVPYTGLKLRSCASVEVGAVFIKFCGSVIGLNKCYTMGLNPSAKCNKLITAYFGYMEVCPYNLKVTRSLISTTVKFNLCGKIPFFSAKCTTFWSKTINEKI
jgi:hypothetical protein